MRMTVKLLLSQADECSLGHIVSWILYFVTPLGSKKVLSATRSPFSMDELVMSIPLVLTQTISGFYLGPDFWPEGT